MPPINHEKGDSNAKHVNSNFKSNYIVEEETLDIFPSSSFFLSVAAAVFIAITVAIFKLQQPNKSLMNSPGSLYSDSTFQKSRRAFSVGEKCAEEGGTCACNGEVRFGSDTKNIWSSTHAMSITSIPCEDSVFGSENPSFGETRICQCSPFPASNSISSDLTNFARKYHLKYGAWQPYHFSHWSQQVGQSYTEFWRDLPCTKTDQLDHCVVSTKDIDTNTNKPFVCGQIPVGRIHSAAVVYGPHISNVSVQSYMLLFGGNNGATFGDTWVFSNGLLNGETLGPKAEAFDPATLFTTKCVETSKNKCNSCNRWHRVHAHAEPRKISSCKFNQVCNHNSAGAIESSKNITLKAFAVEGHSLTLVAGESKQMNGMALMFGGERKNHGFSSEVWYLNQLPVPNVGASEADYGQSFPPYTSTRWICASVFGHAEVYPPVTNCMGVNPSAGVFQAGTLTGTSGTIQSGRLYPLTQCHWDIIPAGFNPNTHAIVISITSLDLADYPCSSTMSITDGDGTLLVRGCNLKSLVATKYVTLTTSFSIDLDYHSDCPHHVGMVVSYNVVSLNDESLQCKHGCSGNGRCQAGQCVCNQGKTGTLCEDDCPSFVSCTSMQHEVSSSYPEPRKMHTMVSTFRESSQTILNSNYITPSAFTEYKQFNILSRTITNTETTTNSSGMLRQILFGGWSSYSHVNMALSDLWVLDMLEQVKTGIHSGIINRWTKISIKNGPSPRYGHTAVMVGTPWSPSYAMIVFGGQNQLKVFGDLYVLRVTTNVTSYSWETVNYNSDSSPPNRTLHAAAKYKSDTNGVEKMIVYGGRLGDTIYNDMWVLSVSSVDGTVGKWVEHNGIKSRGSYLQSSLLWPIDFWPHIYQTITNMGFAVSKVKANTLPQRFGHIMKTITSTAGLETWKSASKDNAMAVKESMLSFSGSTDTRIISSKTHSAKGLVKSTDGGKNPLLYYVCPEVDAICAGPSYKGSSNSNQHHMVWYIRILLFVVVFTISM
jgi:hypothetical protein